MNENLGVVIFYALCILGVAIELVGLLNRDVIFMIIGAAFLISAFLVKAEFKLHIVFWK
ncbi:hypothetical protein HCY45_04350 [Acinetobacter radioresistens]|uniref:hypothetical protein n=1 Tax=Acinetobacter radioresistens TaxID=40216 RepID=UPI0020063A68|nr:hypothetical protein [Acinetobacter radioresistens]MCK4098408.1 hypothetical protein [Acinetobacter radioresistens]